MMTASWGSRKPCLNQQENPVALIKSYEIVELPVQNAENPPIVKAQVF